MMKIASTSGMAEFFAFCELLSDISAFKKRAEELKGYEEAAVKAAEALNAKEESFKARTAAVAERERLVKEAEAEALKTLQRVDADRRSTDGYIKDERARLERDNTHSAKIAADNMARAKQLETKEKELQAREAAVIAKEAEQANREAILSAGETRFAEAKKLMGVA